MGVKFDVMNLGKTGLLDPEQMGYKDSLEIIKDEALKMQKSFVKIGWYLKHIKENELYKEGGYTDVYECASDLLGYSQSTVSRFINICEKFSKNHNSPELDAKYEGFDKSQMIEMLPMEPEQLEQVTSDMTVAEIRSVKNEAKKNATSHKENYDGGDTVIDGEYREIREEVATSQPAETVSDKLHDESWFVKQFVEFEPKKATELFEICRAEKCNSDRAKAIQKHIAPYGYSGYSNSEYSYIFYGFSNGLDIKVCNEKMHLKYGRLVVELMKLLDERQISETTADGYDAEGRELSAYGLPRSEYPDGSLIATEGCGHKYYCFSCAQDCSIRQKDRYCREAPLGNPFPCTTMKILDRLNEEIGEECQFINHDLAEHTAGNNADRPCCKRCKNPCDHRCERKEEPAGEVQQELPILKNNDQRKEWLANYKAWGLWYCDVNIDVNYYKFDFADGSRLVVAEYPQRPSYWSKTKCDEHYYHLLEKNKKGYQGKHTYDEMYHHPPDNETCLVDFLKNLQKK